MPIGDPTTRPPFNNLMDANKPRCSVTDDLLNRLNAQIPLIPVPPTPPVPPLIPGVDYEKTIADLEAKFEAVTKQINDQFKELETKIKPETLPTDGEVKKAEDIITELRAAVDTFNKSLEEWYKKTGCVVNFNWNYQGFKKLEISGIDLIIYRKDAPSEETIKEILARGEPS